MRNIDKYQKDLDLLIRRGLDVYQKSFKKSMFVTEKNRDFFRNNYYIWYSESLEVISQILPNSSKDFKDLYKKTEDKFDIYDYLIDKEIVFIEDELTKDEKIMKRFFQQIKILQSSKRKFKSSLFDIKQLLQSDLFDSELEAAEELNKKGFVRGAGAIAGVVLESYLNQVCQNHKIKVIKKDPSINDFNNLLKDNDVFEITDWRFIQRLADIRNKCDHKKKTEPTMEEIEELIKGVDKIIKTIS